MPLFLPSDPPDSMGEFKPLGPPIRPETSAGPKPSVPTGTPGVFKDPETGKLHTSIPENDQVNQPLGRQPIKPYQKFQGSRENYIVIDDIQPITWQETDEFKKEVEEKINFMKTLMEKAALREYIKQQEKSISTFQEYFEKYLHLTD